MSEKEILLLKALWADIDLIAKGNADEFIEITQDQSDALFKAIRELSKK